MTKRSFESPEGTDELVALGRRLGAAMKRLEDLQTHADAARQAKKHSAAAYLSNDSEHADDQVDNLRNMITCLKATSLSGAAIQIVEALSRISQVWSRFPEADETRGARQDMRAIDRLLYSALDMVDGLAEHKLADLVTPHFSDPHCNPWTPVEERCLEIAKIKPLARAA